MSKSAWLIPPAPTYQRPYLQFRNASSGKERDLKFKDFDHVEIESDIIERLKSEFLSDEMESLLGYLFQERKLDARIQDYVAIIRSIFVKTVAGEGDADIPKEKKVGLDPDKLPPDKFQQFAKLLLAFEIILRVCESNQEMLELINSADRISQRLFDIIFLTTAPQEAGLAVDDIAARIDGKMKELVRKQEEEKRGKLVIKSAARSHKDATEISTKEEAAKSTPDSAYNVLSFIRQNYAHVYCIEGDDFIELVSAPKLDGKKDLKHLVVSLLGLSDFEGEIERTSRGALISEHGFGCKLTIQKLKLGSFYVCYDRTNEEMVVKTTNNYLNLIYQRAVVKKEIGETFAYQSLVTEVLELFTPVHPEIKKELEDQLRQESYKIYFGEALEAQRGFNFDYCFNDYELCQFIKDELAEKSTNIEGALSLIAYSDVIIAGELEKGEKLARLLDNEKIILELVKPIPPKAGKENAFVIDDTFGAFPGLLLIENIFSDARRVISFSISDPIVARTSVMKLIESILQKQQECSRKILEASLQGEREVTEVLTRKLGNAEDVFDSKQTKSSHQKSSAGEAKSTEFQDKTILFSKELFPIINFLKSHNDQFKALKFEATRSSPEMTQKFTPELKSDAKKLEKLILKYKQEVKEREAQEAALLKEESREKSTKKKTAAASKPTPAPAPIAATKSKKEAPDPEIAAKKPTQNHSKQWEECQKLFRDNREKILSQLAAKECEISKEDDKITANFTGIEEENWLIKSLQMRGLKKPEITFDAATKKLSITQNLTGDFSSAIGEFKSFLSKEVVNAKEPIKPKKTKTSSTAATKSASALTTKETTAPVVKATAASPTSSALIDDESAAIASISAPLLIPAAGAEITSAFDATSEIDKVKILDEKMSEFFRTRWNYDHFDQKLIDDLPPEITKLIERFKEDLNITQFAIYGSCIYRRNPKDLDLQVVVRDGFISEKSDEEGKQMKEYLRDLFPNLDTKEPQEHINPRSGIAVWNLKVGQFVDLTFIEKKEHENNQNWVSTTDAQIFDLKKNAFEFQPSFVTEITKHIPHTPSAPLLPLINYQAKDWPLRLAYQIRPQLFYQKITLDAAHYFLSSDHNFKKIEGETFEQKLRKKAEDFIKSHPMEEEEQKAFHQNMAAICEARIAIVRAQTPSMPLHFPPPLPLTLPPPLPFSIAAKDESSPTTTPRPQQNKHIQHGKKHSSGRK